MGAEESVIYCRFHRISEKVLLWTGEKNIFKTPRLIWESDTASIFQFLTHQQSLDNDYLYSLQGQTKRPSDEKKIFNPLLIRD